MMGTAGIRMVISAAKTGPTGHNAGTKSSARVVHERFEMVSLGQSERMLAGDALAPKPTGHPRPGHSQPSVVMQVRSPRRNANAEPSQVFWRLIGGLSTRQECLAEVVAGRRAAAPSHQCSDK